MIVGSSFPLDSERLAVLQHDVYGKSVGLIVDCSQRAYRRAEAILGVSTELGQSLPVHSFDHRAIQYVHDQIAAQFRYLHINKPRLFDITEAGSDSESFLRQWNDFLVSELQIIGDEHASFYRLICVAASFPNPHTMGIEAEQTLREIVDERYPHVGRG